MIRILHLIRSHSVAFLALMVSLAGTSYAAFVVPNHSLTPNKLDPRFTGGYVRSWASVSSGGRLLASGGKPTVRMQRSTPSGDYIILWHAKPTTGCTALASIDARGVATSGPLVGYALPVTGNAGSRGEESVVHTYDSQGQAAALPFDVALLCSIPRR